MSLPCSIEQRGRKAETATAATERAGGNFFVFPHFTFLYAMLGKPSPQPLLWFHRGVTYPRDYDPRCDEWIVRDLEKSRVNVVVLETRSTYATA